MANDGSKTPAALSAQRAHPYIGSVLKAATVRDCLAS